MGWRDFAESDIQLDEQRPPRLAESEGRHDDIQTWVITGDVVNHYAGVEAGVRKPPLYSLLIVPEDDGGDRRTLFQTIPQTLA